MPRMGKVMVTWQSPVSMTGASPPHAIKRSLWPLVAVIPQHLVSSRHRPYPPKTPTPHALMYDPASWRGHGSTELLARV